MMALVAVASCIVYEDVGDYRKALAFAQMPSDIERIEGKLLTLGSSKLLFDEDYQPRERLVVLLNHLGMSLLNPFENAVVQINNWAQKHLLRRGERWEEQSERFEVLKPTIQPLLTELGFTDSTAAQFKTYDGAIVHGGLLSRVTMRLDYLVRQWNEGVRFSHLYFLTGDRPLDPAYENALTLNQTPLTVKTEMEMIELVWNLAEIPEAMRKEVKVHFIAALMKKDPSSDKWLRPTTDDTVESWLKQEPLPGRYLAVTNAPYTNRQDLVIRGIAPKEYGFDTIGPGCDEGEKVAIILDELARCIFQINLEAEKG